MGSSLARGGELSSRHAGTTAAWEDQRSLAKLARYQRAGCHQLPNLLGKFQLTSPCRVTGCGPVFSAIPRLATDHRAAAPGRRRTGQPDPCPPSANGTACLPRSVSATCSTAITRWCRPSPGRRAPVSTPCAWTAGPTGSSSTGPLSPDMRTPPSHPVLAHLGGTRPGGRRARHEGGLPYNFAHLFEWPARRANFHILGDEEVGAALQGYDESASTASVWSSPA